MGYRDDFYIADNIVGYTGTLGRSPTVYFQHDDETGHITQYHGVDSNVGREEVLSDQDYIGLNENDPDNGALVFHETWPNHFDANGDVLEHWSRNVLHPVGGPEDRALLSQAIWLYDDLKKLEGANPVWIENPNYVEGESRVQSLRRKFGG